jgi:hypothetical protein
MDSKEVNQILGNTVKYSYGFLDGLNIEQIYFNEVLGETIVDILNKYIDSKAKANPQSLHHIYEWNMIGNPSGRLFEIKSRASKRVIHFQGKFLQSKSTAETSSEPFVDKAKIMEDGISISIEPKNGPLVFKDNGETVFTMNSIFIEHPGGDEVAGSFGRLIEEFFSQYLTGAVLSQLMNKLNTPKEFVQNFPNGVRHGGRSTGIKAGRNYLKADGVVIE